MTDTNSTATYNSSEGEPHHAVSVCTMLQELDVMTLNL